MERICEVISKYFVNRGHPTELTLSLLASPRGQLLFYRLWTIYNYHVRKSFNKMVEELELDLNIDIEDYRYKH